LFEGLPDSRRRSSPKTTVAYDNREWRKHGATSKSLKPEPKGDGTVW
jgi:hypothetical protein